MRGKNDNALERCFEHIRKQHEAARFLQLAATFSQREARCPLLEDEDGELKLFVRGVAYEPECRALGDRLPAVIENGAPLCDGDYAFVATPLLLRARQYLSP